MASCSTQNEYHDGEVQSDPQKNFYFLFSFLKYLCSPVGYGANQSCTRSFKVWFSGGPRLELNNPIVNFLFSLFVLFFITKFFSLEWNLYQACEISIREKKIYSLGNENSS